MRQEKTAGADNPHGLVVVKRLASATYQASRISATVPGVCVLEEADPLVLAIRFPILATHFGFDEVLQ